MTAPSTTRSLVRDSGFRSFWAGQTVSQFGDRISELAIPLIAVSALHASAGQISWLTALVWMPNLLGLWVGSWVDHRTHRRRLMILADLVRAGVLISLPVASLLGAVTLTQLYVVTFLTGAGAVLFNTAYPAFFTRLVDPAEYLEANSRLSSTRAASTVAGPAIAGVLVQALTAPMTVLLDAVSFLGSAALLTRIEVGEVAVVVGDSSIWRRTREGVRFIAAHRILRAGLGCAATVNFFTFLTGGGLIVLYANRSLGLSAGLIGLAFGLGSTGALLGAVLAPRISVLIGVGRSVGVGAILFPAPIAIMALAHGSTGERVAILAGAEFLSGIGVMLFDVNLNAINATVTPDRMRSRSAGAYSTVNYGVRPIAAVLGGVLATHLGLRETLLIAAVGGSCSVLWLLASPIPSVRTLTDDVLSPAK